MPNPLACSHAGSRAMHAVQKRARIELVMAAAGAMLDEQLVFAAGIPIRAAYRGRMWQEFFQVCRHQSRSLPSINVEWLDMMPPCACTSATSASLTCRSPAAWRNWRHGFRQGKHGAGVSGMAMRQQPAVGIHWQRSFKRGFTRRDERTRLALRAKAEIFELDQHHRGKAIINSGDVDIRRAQSGHLKCPAP